MNRRDFLRIAGGAGGSVLLGSLAARSVQAETEQEFEGFLVDIYRCTGCRKCEEACADENGLPFVGDINDKSVFEQHRTTSPSQWTVVNRYRTEKGEVYVKSQCMHCNQPACASACLVKAMMKTRGGPVIWRGDRCMGCRYCMVSCPYDVPKFEYNSPVPKIQKCILCAERLKKGQAPACVAVCPVEALRFGKRRTLVEFANSEIYNNPGRYVHHIYGEHEVGGTGILYLSPVPFDQVGCRTDLGTEPYPELSKDFLYGVPVVLLLWPAFLLGVSQIRKPKEEV